MKKFLLLYFCMLMISKSHSQQNNINNDPIWYKNLADARNESDISGKPILVNFSGSDWSEYSVKLKEEILDTPEFKLWASKNVVLFEADFPKKTKVDEKMLKQNQGLAGFFKVKNIPTVCLFFMKVNSEKKTVEIKPICRTNYQEGGPKNFTDLIEKMVMHYKESAVEKKSEKTIQE